MLSESDTGFNHILLEGGKKNTERNNVRKCLRGCSHSEPQSRIGIINEADSLYRVYKAELNTLINDCELYLLGVNVRECVRPCQPVSQMAHVWKRFILITSLFFLPHLPFSPFPLHADSCRTDGDGRAGGEPKMFITTNKLLHRRRPADTGSPWEMLLLQACPRLAPRVPSRLADSGEPSGATLAASVKWAERFFPQAQSDVVKPCEENFFPPLP